MAIFVPRFLRQLRDIVIASPADGEVLTYDSADEKWKNEAGGGGGGPPTGAAGGVLGGTYPNPGFAVDMATQAELDAHVTDITDAHDATAVSVAPFGTIAATQVQAALEEIVAEAVTDLGPAVILAPAASARNVIQPTAGDVIAAIVKAHAAQSVDLTQWQDSGGTSRLAVTKFGELRQVLSILDGGVVEGAYEANRFLTDFSLTLDPTSPTVGGVANNAYSFWAQNAVDDKQYHNITTMFAYSLFRGTKTLPPGQGQAVEHTAIYGMGQTHEASTGSITRLRGVNAVALHTGSGSVDELEGVYSLAGLDDFGGAPRIASYMAAFVGETYVLTAGAVVPDMAVFYAKSPDAQAAVTRASGLDVLNQGGANIVTSYGARIRPQSGATTSYGLVVEGGKSLFTDGLVIALIAAPADAAYANGQGGWWWDQANSLPKWKGKTSGGVVVNFTPANATALADHISDAADAHDASAISFSPTGTIAATDVQAAIAEVASEAGAGGAPTDASYVTVNAEAGLSAETLYTALKLDDFAAPDDNTDLNASTTKHGLLPKLSNVVTEFLNGTGAFSVPAGGSASAGVGIYGTGADGTVTFDGSTTVLGLVPASSIYTLTRDIFLAAGTINSGVVIVTNGYRIFCSGTLTNNGTIRWNGLAASGTNGATAGTMTANSNSSFNTNNTSNGYRSPGIAGGNGGTVAGTAGQNTDAGGSVWSYGGRGGSGGLGLAGAGAAAGTQTLPDGRVSFRWVEPLVRAFTLAFQSIVLPVGGTGGGGGGGDAVNSGGGGGAGGGYVIVCARLIAGTGAIQARGGNGGTCTTGNCGGGGGGGGGVVVVVSQSVVAGAVSGQTIDANAGTGGVKVGTGVDGVNGSAGTTFVLGH